jgi:hypothetical protein
MAAARSIRAPEVVSCDALTPTSPIDPMRSTAASWRRRERRWFRMRFVATRRNHAIGSS